MTTETATAAVSAEEAHPNNFNDSRTIRPALDSSFLDQKDDWLVSDDEGDDDNDSDNAEEGARTSTTARRESAMNRSREARRQRLLETAHRQRTHSQPRATTGSRPTSLQQSTNTRQPLRRTLSAGMIRDKTRRMIYREPEDNAKLFPSFPSLLSNLHSNKTNNATVESYRIQAEDVCNLVNDQGEFARLKLALKEKGAITNEILKQRIHVYMKNRSERLHHNSNNNHQASNNGNIMIGRDDSE